MATLLSNGHLLQKNSEQAKKLTVTRELNQLETKFQSLTKEKQLQLYKKVPGQYSSLEESDKRLIAEYKSDRLKVKKELHKLKGMVQKFREELRHVKPTPEFLEQLKVVMENIEQNIMSFKDSQREEYENMMISEIQHTQEISALEKKFEAWSRLNDAPADERKLITKLPTARDVTKDLPPEVAAFEKFLLQTGGVRGGWDEYDHNTFLRWRVRYKGKPSFIDEAIARLPTRTAQQVREHEDWYQEFLSLQEHKKEAIQQWKKLKEEEKKLGTAEINDSSEEDDVVLSEQQRELFEQQRQEKAQKLNAWKIQKEIERVEKEEQRLLQIKQKEKHERDWQQKQQELRRKVMEYKQKKAEEEEFLAMEAEEQQRQQQEELKERLRENRSRIDMRNDYAINSRFQKRKEDEEKRLARQRREDKLRSQYEPLVNRDPNRLLQPTAGWKERTKQVGASSESGRVYHSVPHRAVPSWRQGL